MDSTSVKRRCGRSRLGLTLAVTHALAVILVASLIVKTSEPDWPMAWTLFLFLDFPVSLFLFAINWLLRSLPAHVSGMPQPFGDVWNFLAPIAFFGIVGSAWWYWLGRLLAGDRARETAVESGERVGRQG